MQLVSPLEETVMGKLVLSMFISLDGYIEGPDGFVAPAWSGDLETHWAGYSTQRAAHLIYGRTNFEFNKGFWEPAETDPNAPAAGVAHTPIMNRLPKSVITRSRKGELGWRGRVIEGDLSDAVNALKASVEGEIHCFGGAGAAQALVERDLVDEYRLMITPDLFGGGKRLFEPGFERIGLELLESRALDTGAVILHYRRSR
jgi:dihydrofolate reductase